MEKLQNIFVEIKKKSINYLIVHKTEETDNEKMWNEELI